MKQKTLDLSLTKGQIKNRLKTSKGLSRDILMNYDLSDEQLSENLKKPIGIISRFRKLTYAWITGTFVGKTKNKYKRKGKIGRPRIKPKKLTYKNYGKTCVHNALHKLMLHEDSPKVGKVPTLPFELTLEKRILKDSRLDGIKFLGFEFGYSVAASEQSKNTLFKQRKFLRNNPKIQKRLPIINHDINEYLMVEASNSCSHILTDYCGTFSKNKEVVNYIISNNIVQKGGLIWFTFCTRDKFLKNKSVSEEITSTIKQAGGKNYKYEPIEGLERVGKTGIFRYPSESGVGSPMYTLVLRRIK